MQLRYYDVLSHVIKQMYWLGLIVVICYVLVNDLNYANSIPIIDLIYQ